MAARVDGNGRGLRFGPRFEKAHRHPDSTIARNRIAVKKAIADDGTSGRIDCICAKLMPRHVP